jgi:hypothetical protein
MNNSSNFNTKTFSRVLDILFEIEHKFNISVHKLKCYVIIGITPMYPVLFCYDDQIINLNEYYSMFGYIPKLTNEQINSQQLLIIDENQQVTKCIQHDKYE